MNLRTYLENTEVTYDDKINRIKKEVDINILKRWAVSCAESVLPNYEKEYPNDSRVRDCIESVKLYLDGKIELDEMLLKKEGVSADYSAASAANSAAYGAASAASAANSAAYGAASAAYGANSAAYMAANMAARKKQEELNIRLLLELLVKKIKNTKIARKVYSGRIKEETKEYLIIPMYN